MPAHPLTPGAPGSVRQPVPPDSPTPGAGAGGSADTLHDRVESLTARAIGVEAAVQGLQQGAQAALGSLLTQAQAEFEAQQAALLALRADAQQEASELRCFLGGTRQTVERL